MAADKLQEVICANERFRHLGRNEVDVLNACVNDKLTINKGEKGFDVCQSIQTIADRAAEKKGMETLLDNIKKLMEKMGWSAEQSMDMLSISESDRNYLLSIGSNKVTGYCLH